MHRYNALGSHSNIRLNVTEMFYRYILLCLSFYKTPPVNADASEPWARHNATPRPRVFHGQDVTTDEYPYIALIIVLKSSRHIRICSISIIRKNYALTAAHCTLRQRYRHYVWYGNYLVSPLQTGAYTDVSEYILHPSFCAIGGKLTGNDIALVRFGDVILPSYGRLSAVDHLTMIGLPVKYVGGGKTKKSGDDLTRPLQVGEGAITVCPPSYKRLSKILVCVSPKCSSRQNSGAKGDSGGPLFFDDRIIGVMSFGDQSSFASVSAFAPVSPYLHWINNIIHST